MRFNMVWRSIHGPTLEEEHAFHPVRKWRADYAHHDSRTLIEVEGGIHSYGRHNRASGFIADSEKYLEATLLGWRVIRLTKDQITPETLTRIKTLIEGVSSGSIMDMLN
jgi:very-short-patch-repair endonuclease